jgi:iron-sulfur cluster assembly protein
MQLPVTISPEAIAEVKNIKTNKSIPPNYALRLGIKGGGCGTMGFLIGFDTPKPGDDTYEFEGLTILVEKKHTMYLLGLELDFENTADARGFLFIHPSQKAKQQAEKEAENS